MKISNNNIWVITPKTNLHVGNENATSYGLIDLAIQRDALTGLPNINSSSLKGALNEYATMEAKLSEDQRIRIFGCDKNGKITDTQKGECTFFDAEILALPVADNDTQYKLAYCTAQVERIVNKAKLFGCNITSADIVKLIGNGSKKETAEFNELCHDDNLPIIARNEIKDGVSANLWYEQVLPAETMLITFISEPEGDNSLSEAINGKIIQVGANGSIGYGFCEFKHL